MNIPALIQCKEIQEDWDGKMAVVDGYNACVYVDPTPDLLESLKKRQQEDQKKLALLAELKGKPNTTLDGKTVQVFANIGGMSDVGAVQQNDAGGVGLFRTEFVYLNCTDYPTEEYQFEAYKQVLESLAPKKVVVRTCDIGADKTVDYMKLDHEDNPALGYRAIRICLTRKDFFKTQLRALLRASAYGNMSIMFPMITSLRELQDAKAVLEECKAELTAEGKKFSDKIEVGTMIETPAAVLVADDLAQECDFFSIGTNDLTQYTCALDRQNAKLEPFFDPHHPAVLKAIRMTIEAGLPADGRGRAVHERQEHPARAQDHPRRGSEQALCQECLSSPDGTVKGAAAALSANQSVGKGARGSSFLIATRSKFTKLPPDKPQFHG